MAEFRFPWCSKCNDNFPMRKKMFDEFEEDGGQFYCPYGHGNIITRRDIVIQFRNARTSSSVRWNTISRMQKREASYRGVQARQRNRLLRGACPYCNKKPVDMVKHIQDRHTSKGN